MDLPATTVDEAEEEREEDEEEDCGVFAFDAVEDGAAAEEGESFQEFDSKFQLELVGLDEGPEETFVRGEGELGKKGFAPGSGGSPRDWTDGGVSPRLGASPILLSALSRVAEEKHIGGLFPRQQTL